ncbi:hypothetical protein Trydic_g1752 [Trypoxylus dichotomus]
MTAGFMPYDGKARSGTGMYVPPFDVLCVLVFRWGSEMRGHLEMEVVHVVQPSWQNICRDTESLERQKVRTCEFGLGGLDFCKMEAMMYLMGSTMVEGCLTGALPTPVIISSVGIYLGVESKLESFDSTESSSGEKE